jgi:hypothetical protein
MTIFDQHLLRLGSSEIDSSERGRRWRRRVCAPKGNLSSVPMPAAPTIQPRTHGRQRSRCMYHHKTSMAAATASVAAGGSVPMPPICRAVIAYQEVSSLANVVRGFIWVACFMFVLVSGLRSPVSAASAPVALSLHCTDGVAPRHAPRARDEGRMASSSNLDGDGANPTTKLPIGDLTTPVHVCTQSQRQHGFSPSVSA